MNGMGYKYSPEGCCAATRGGKTRRILGRFLFHMVGGQEIDIYEKPTMKIHGIGIGSVRDSLGSGTCISQLIASRTSPGVIICRHPEETPVVDDDTAFEATHCGATLAHYRNRSPAPSEYKYTRYPPAGTSTFSATNRQGRRQRKRDTMS